MKTFTTALCAVLLTSGAFAAPVSHASTEDIVSRQAPAQPDFFAPLATFLKGLLGATCPDGKPCPMTAITLQGVPPLDKITGGVDLKTLTGGLIASADA